MPNTILSAVPRFKSIFVFVCLAFAKTALIIADRVWRITIQEGTDPVLVSKDGRRIISVSDEHTESNLKDDRRRMERHGAALSRWFGVVFRCE